ncbi:MAG: RNA polymerase sigma factor [Sphingobacteriaceae bacterium]
MDKLSTTEEYSLLLKVRDGNLDAFNQFYKLYAEILYVRLLRLMKNPETVEEILQDVFLKVWSKREEIDPEKGFRTFVYRIADHLAIDLFRKASRDKKLQLELWAASISFYYHTEEDTINKERRSVIQEAIESLPPKRREIVLLCKMEDKSYKEAADLLGLSVSTVSNQLVSAMKDIKSYILKHYSKDFLVGFLLLYLSA